VTSNKQHLVDNLLLASSIKVSLSLSSRQRYWKQLERLMDYSITGRLGYDLYKQDVFVLQTLG
jgi:predicted secreted Zn-dependent protease